MWCNGGHIMHHVGKNKVIAPYGADIRMVESSPSSVPRQPEEPTPEQVFDEMRPCEPYTVGDLVDVFEDTSRWTVQRRLETLQDEDNVRKKKHSENRVSWWVHPD